MKKLFCLIPFVMLVGLIVLSCQESQNPIAVTSSEENGGRSLAKALTVTNNYEVPYEMYPWIPCALDGNGEYIHLTGRLHILECIIFDNVGGNHVKIHYQPKDLKGTGLESGDKYQGTGVTQETQNLNGIEFPYSYTYVNNFRMIGQGKGNNYLVHETWHITINANGDLTAFVDNWSVECK